MICVGGAVPHSYLFVVLLGQLELCPFHRARCSGPSLHSLLAACRLGGSAWLDPQCGEWVADDCVQLCTCVPPPPPACLPSVCEINVVFVWISAAFVALLHLSQKGKQAYRPQPHASLLPFISTVSALDKAGSWVGWEGCWAEDSVPLNICIDGHDEVGMGRGMGPGVCVGEDGECPSPMPSGL